MRDALFIGIDIGTQGTKAVLCDVDGQILETAFVSSKLIYEDAVTVYEDAEDMFSSVLTVIGEVASRVGEKSKQIRAIGIDAQMAGIMGIKKDFSAATPYDSWLDMRCSKYTDLLERTVGEEAIEYSGGQFIHAHAPKILWWKNERPDEYKEIEKFVQPNGYVAGRLCGLSSDEAFMDYTFLHFNIFSDNKNCCFREEMLEQFGIAKEKMPKIVSPETIVGEILPEIGARCHLPEGVKVIAGCGDTAASSLGAGITRAGLAYDVAGTASVFACCTDQFAPDTKKKTILFSRSVCEGLYLPLAYISGGGLCLRWYSNLTGQSLDELNRLVDPTVVGETPIFLPHFSGRTCPLDDQVSGAFLGLNSRMQTGDLYRSILEGIAFEYRSYWDIMHDNGCVTDNTVVRGVGGGAKSAEFSQIKADVLGLTYTVPGKVDSAPVAMALLAAHAIGARTESLQELFEPGESIGYEPNRELTEHYEHRAAEYLHLLNTYGTYAGRDMR